ncbi:hypothetical protein CLV98_102501 [Dyadobacter jejuensis]|uniref:Uncharacterized protein n=1 Tax=Dyadobacter jejuensis TaxID=1082580 RepID=A0A316BAU6_9BACT|nr:hypothetical protein [Dyadobacter jejuensis]PWJ59667.1 hypothetical protein CLV98_102501 [Dyadobacter jejuensis]
MKGTSIVLKIAVLLCLVCAANVHAQSFEEENTKVMERMDTESFKGKVLLNKAIALDYQLEPFRIREKNKEGTYVMHLDAIIHIISLKTKTNNHETTTTT